MSEHPTLLHASAVAVDGHGVLIVGPSGSGKSLLAADLISRGAVLIADDQTLVLPGDPPVLTAPEQTSGLIELRGVGLLRLSETTNAPAWLIVDLASKAGERLPDLAEHPLLNHPVRIIFGKEHPNLAAVVILATTGTLLDPTTHLIE